MKPYPEQNFSGRDVCQTLLTEALYGSVCNLGGGSIDIYFIQLYNTSESSLQIYLELENPFSVPPYSERLKTGMRVELEVGPGSLFCSIRLWASS